MWWITCRVMWYVPMVTWYWSYRFVAETGGRKYCSQQKLTLSIWMPLIWRTTKSLWGPGVWKGHEIPCLWPSWTHSPRLWSVVFERTPSSIPMLQLIQFNHCSTVVGGLPQENVAVQYGDNQWCRPCNTEQAQNSHGSGKLDWTADIQWQST